MAYPARYQTCACGASRAAHEARGGTLWFRAGVLRCPGFVPRREAVKTKERKR